MTSSAAHASGDHTTPRRDRSEEARVLHDRIAAQVAAVDASAAVRGVARYRIAGAAVEARFAGDAAAAWTSGPFGSAMVAPEPGVAAARDVELRIDVASGANALLDVCAHADAAGAIVSDERHAVHLLPSMAAALDREHGRIVALLRNVEELPHWERAKPLATLVGVWCNDRGVRVVHAGTASRGGDGVLFVGASGSGKSTAALACLAAGFDFLGDDVVGLRVRDGGVFEVVRLYATATLERTHLERAVLAGERATGAADARDKVIVTPGARRPERLASSAEVRAVLLPRLTDAPRTTLRRASGREALLALAPSSIVRRAAPGGATLADLAGLVRAVPCWWLDMSRRPDEIPGCVDRVLREAAGR